MNKKFTRKLGTMTLATVLAFGGIVGTVNAAEDKAPSKLVKKITLKEGKNAYTPAVKRTFTITGEAATEENAPKKEGGKAIDFNLVKAAPKGLVKFKLPAKSDGLTLGEDGKSVDIQFEDSRKEESRTKTVEFVYDTNVLNKVPGIYRVKITESRGDRDGLTDDNSRYMDLYVKRDPESDELYIANTVLSDKDGKKRGQDQGNKDGKKLGQDQGNVEFENKYDTVDLTVGNLVKGDMADKNKVFRFKITINGTKGERYIYTTGNRTENRKGEKVKGIEADTDVGENFIPSNTPVEVDLKHNETITIEGLTAGDTITVEEIEDLAHTGYTVDDRQFKDKEVMGNADKEVKITNKFEEITPTGLIQNVAPYAITLTAAIVGGGIYVSSKKKEEELA